MKTTDAVRQPPASLDEVARVAEWFRGRLFLDEAYSPRLGWASFDTTGREGKARLLELLDGERDVIVAGRLSRISVTDWICVPCVSEIIGASEAEPVGLIYMRSPCGRVYAAVGAGALDALERAVQRVGLSPWAPALTFDVVRAPSLDRWTDVTLRDPYALHHGQAEGRRHAH